MATNGEHLVPGLGDKQAAVLNNEHARQLEHKRHLEELGFPEEVEPEFVRHAPVSYDDPSNPTPSRVVNQAGQDLGDPNKEESDHFKKFKYTPEKKIAKEAFLDFIQKQPDPYADKLTPSEFFAGVGKRSVFEEAAKGTFQTAAAKAARAADPSMTTNVAGTRDASDKLFDFDPTGSKGSGGSVGGYADGAAILGTGAGKQGGLPSDAFKTLSDEIENADFDTRFNEAQTRQLVKEAMNEVFLNKDREKPEGFKEVDTWLKPKEKDYSELWRFPTEEEKKQGAFSAGFNHLGRILNIGAQEGRYALNDIGNAFEKTYKDTGAWKLFPDSWIANPESITQKDIKDFESKLSPKEMEEVSAATDKAVNQLLTVDWSGTDYGSSQVQPGMSRIKQSGGEQTITVDPKETDPAGVPLEFQPEVDLMQVKHMKLIWVQTK